MRLAGLFALTVAGCAAVPPSADIRAEQPWMIQKVVGTSYRTDHYLICTTISNRPLIARFARLMEAAYGQYGRWLPPIRPDAAPIDTVPMEVDLLSTETQWQTLTRFVAGSAADAYLRVGSGGYTIGDRVVCRLTTEQETFSVAAHEGLHQYAARHFQTRLPPTIEEGIATTFENVTVTNQNVVFDVSINERRRTALQRAFWTGTLIPLDELIQMNAGDVAGRGDVSETYYGQCWALARMLSADPVYQDGLKRMISSAAAGQVSRVSDNGTDYRPAAVQPLLEKYVTRHWQAFVADFNAWVKRAAENPPAIDPYMRRN